MRTNCPNQSGEQGQMPAATSHGVLQTCSQESPVHQPFVQLTMFRLLTEAHMPSSSIPHQKQGYVGSDGRKVHKHGKCTK
mmetsp:Transcript_24277/g.60829  ORF Transcript_24277/g.60829 Transcript_24277/m.60829 type:complete len:80 (+) Transcript_24277:1490-1729(+)